MQTASERERGFKLEAAHSVVVEELGCECDVAGGRGKGGERTAV